MPNQSIFVSDIHLSESRPSITHAFINFIDKIASQYNAIYILGDLFEYWIGDDSKKHTDIINAIKRLTNRHTKVFLMHGNRDFLIGHAFEKKTGATLLKDPTLVEIFDKRVLLSHGDSLCTDDLEYQTYKKEVRKISWQNDFLKKSLNERLLIADQLRKESELKKKNKSNEIMDVNIDAINQLIIQFNYPDLLIHGHTHKPDRHPMDINGYKIERIVLGDWYEQGSYLTFNANGIKTNQI